MNITLRGRIFRIGEVCGRVVLTLLGIIIGLILIINTAFIVKGVFGKKAEVPKLFGFFPLVVQSGSMSGAVETGDLLLDKEVKTSELKEGDIISFWEDEAGGTVITHRIVTIKTDEKGKIEYVTKGDANTSNDLQTVSEKKVIGVVNKRIPKLGNFVMFMQTTKGIILFIVAPLVLFYFLEKLSNKNKRRLKTRVSNQI